jgi:hypothetical protein
MQSGKLNSRITIKRLVKTDDGFGGFNSTLSDIATVWCDLKQISGEISDKFGKREHETKIELLMRKKTSDLIIIGDIFIVENDSQNYRINEKFDSELKFLTRLTATKSQ